MSALLGTKTGGVVDGQQIFDSSHVLAADFGTRVLSNAFSGGVNWASALLRNDDGTIIFDWNNGIVKTSGNSICISTENRQLIANDGTTVALDWSDPAGVALGTIKSGNGAALTGVSASTVTGTTTNDNAAAGKVGEYISASVTQASAQALTTATPKTIASVSLTAGDWDITVIGALTAASTGTEFDVAIGTTTNSMTGTVMGDSRAQTPTVSLAGADATLMIPAFRASISSTTIYYLIVQETFTVGSPKAYGRISARRVR